MSEYNSSKLLQEINDNVWRGLVGGSICFVESTVSRTKTRLLILQQVKLKEEYHGIVMVWLQNQFHGSYDCLVDNWRQLQSMAKW